MGLQAEYDPGEDRMRLTLQAGDGTGHAFWVTRRQWLGLLQALISLPPAVVSQDVEDTPSPRQNRLAAAAGFEPTPLKAIRLRRLKHGVKLALVLDSEQGVFINVPQAEITQLQAMLRQQAHRAGWDVDAALARLSLMQLASAVVRKSRLH